MSFRDILRDVVITTAPIQFESILLTQEDRGTGEALYIESFTTDRRILMRARAKELIPEITLPIGLTNLNILQGLLNLNTYRTDDAKIVPVLNRTGDEVQALEFSSNGAKSSVLTQKSKFHIMMPDGNAQSYDVTVVPTAAAVQELKNFAAVYASTKVSERVTPYTEDNKLKFFIGDMDKNNHNGVIVFADTEEELKRGYTYQNERLQQCFTRVNQASEIKMGISSRGAIRIDIDTGVVHYEFYVMGSSS